MKALAMHTCTHYRACTVARREDAFMPTIISRGTKPIFDRDGITLYRGDSRELLAGARRESVDLFLSDPPYGISYRSRRVDHTTLPIAGDENLNVLRDVLPLSDAMLRPDRHAYVFASPLRLGEAAVAVDDVWRVKNLLVWDKGDMGTRGDLDADYARNWEAIIYATKGRRPLTRPRPRTTFRYDWSAKRNPVHPTVKPVPLLAWLITKSTQPGEIILDPFAGSGTTLLAARELGRRAIGIELEASYCDAAVRALEAPARKAA
jgi:DNA modification methylase